MLAEMEMKSLLDAGIDSKHRSIILQGRNLETLVTRTPKKNGMIHPYWVDRYVFIYLVLHLMCYLMCDKGQKTSVMFFNVQT